MSEGAYRSKIDRLIRERNGEVVLNGSHVHAAVIIERMFARAQLNMRILSRTFDPRIYGASSTVDQAELFLGLPDRRAQILVEEKGHIDASRHPFLERLVNYDNLEVRIVPRNLIMPLKINFAVMDDFGLRFEKDATETSAFATFGNEELPGRLVELFSKVWKVSERLPLQRNLTAILG